MTIQNDPHPKSEKLIKAYDQMLERVKDWLEDAEQAAKPRLHDAVETAKEKAAELGELTREEAEKIGNYLKRDVEGAAQYLAGPEGQELKDWLRFDIERVEQRVLDMFFSVADQTKIDLMRLQQQAEHPNTYHSGEITGIGTLICTQCGTLYHFHATGHIPPCAKCHNSLFERVSEEP